MKPRLVTILCSGFGLGFYNPGLIVSSQLRGQGVPTEVLVFESFIEQEKQDKILDSKKAYHDNFSVALMATKIPRDIRDSLDFDKLDSLLAEWSEQNRTDFIVLSGHWVYVLDMYRARLGESGKAVQADMLYVDSDYSPSWRSLRKYNPDYTQHYRDAWLYHAGSRSINCYIPVGPQEPIALGDRPNRYVIHGGGWGMGTYSSKIPELEARCLELDIVAYELEEAQRDVPGNRIFMNDPGWVAWRKGPSGEHEFPLFGEIVSGEQPCFANGTTHHGLYDVIRQAKAIISKPGAGTLMDSLASATPVIMLEPFGPHERCNSEIWEEAGLGISYEAWKQSGFAAAPLAQMHKRLLELRSSLPSYTDVFLQTHGIGKEGGIHVK
ncbi:UDP-glucuronosyltransferase [Paenibacillus sp. y28]|uniref:UDP-glucuronosyltransferase n=1 Tax=Paenibacillus sp. y28 TaxID=3129110 RepID=UPI003015D984